MAIWISSRSSVALYRVQIWQNITTVFSGTLISPITLVFHFLIPQVRVTSIYMSFTMSIVVFLSIPLTVYVCMLTAITGPWAHASLQQCPVSFTSVYEYVNMYQPLLLEDMRAQLEQGVSEAESDLRYAQLLTCQYHTARRRITYAFADILSNDSHV